jgi:hypothetical protein
LNTLLVKAVYVEIPRKVTTLFRCNVTTKS